MNREINILINLQLRVFKLFNTLRFFRQQYILSIDLFNNNSSLRNNCIFFISHYKQLMLTKTFERATRLLERCSNNLTIKNRAVYWIIRESRNKQQKYEIQSQKLNKVSAQLKEIHDFFKRRITALNKDLRELQLEEVNHDQIMKTLSDLNKMIKRKLNFLVGKVRRIAAVFQQIGRKKQKRRRQREQRQRESREQVLQQTETKKDEKQITSKQKGNRSKNN